MANSKRFVVKNGLETQNIQFVSTDGTETITATVLEDGSLSFSGSSGQLFSITDSLTGSIFSVNDISGIPSIEVFDDGRVILAESTGNVGIGILTPTEKLHVAGSINIPTGSTYKINGVSLSASSVGAEPANANIQSHISSTSNPHSVTATQVGLGNVTNESKATMFTSPTFTGTVSGVTKAMVGLGNVDNTSDANKPISTATQTALDGKQATITGGATSITSSNLTASRTLVSDGSGKVAVSAVTSTELGHVSGVTSAIQTQLNAKVNTSAVGAVNGVASLGSDGKVPFAQLPSSVTGGMRFKGVASFQNGDFGQQPSDTLGYFSSDNFAGWVSGSSSNPTTNIGEYYILSDQGTIEGSTTPDSSGFRYVFQEASTVGTPQPEDIISNVLATVEPGDWIVLVDYIVATKTLVFGIINNTYRLATTTNNGIVVLSNSTSTATTGNNVITDGILNGLVGDTSTKLGRGDYAKAGFDHSAITNGTNPHNTTFANIASKPTTISGYGITDALVLGETSTTAYRGDRGKTAYDHSQITNGTNPHNTTFANIASKPTTISGYGITDAVTTSGNQTISGVKTFTGSIDFSGTVSNSLNLNNNNITGVNHITINDPGPNEGIEWTGGNAWKIYESPNDLTTNSGGNLQVVQNTTRRATFNTSGQIEVPVATGTAPFVVTSTTRVNNLNVATSGTADTLTTSRTISLGTAVTSTATSFNGSSNITIPVNTVRESFLSWGGQGLAGQVTPIGMSMSSEHNANRLAFINGDSLYFEYSSDAGSTWTDYGYNNSQKSQFCTLSLGVPIGRTSGEYTTDSRTRVTLTAQNGTTGYVYTNPRKMLIEISSSGGMQVLVETRTGANYLSDGAWSTFGTYTLSGWSGWNDIPLVLGTLGGGTTQTGNNWQLRLTFIMTSKNTTHPNTAQVNKLRIYGENTWNMPSTLAATNNLYSFDMSQNATFPANLNTNGTFGLRASTTGSSATQIPVFTADPSSTTRTLVTRTPAQLRADIGAGTGNGTVTSVSGTGTVSGLTLTGTVTTTGNITLGGTLSTPVSTINDSTTVGQNLVKLTNPSAISFLRVNANNTVDALSASDFRTAIGAGTGNGTVTSVSGTAPIVSSGGATPAISITAATTSAAGSMSSADKTKLDGIAANANNYTHPAYTARSITATGVEVIDTFTSDASGHVTAATKRSMPAATTSAAGVMSSADKTKLDGIAAGAQVNVATNLAQGTRTTTTVPITSSTGTSATLDIATTSLAGVMSSADKTKLDGIASGAQVNVATNLSYTDSTRVINSSTGTGATLPVVVAGGISGLMTGADKTKLDGIASGATANTGTVTGVTGTAPIVSSGGTAPAISISAATQSAAGSMSSADKTKLDGIATGATANDGTVTSVSAGTQISGMAMTITNGTTTPSIATSVSNAANFRTAIGAGTGNGTVTSVGGTGTVAGLTLTGTVTTSGNLTLGGTLSTPVSTINDSTTVGQNLVKLANPSAIRFIRINADNTVSALSNSDFRTAIGAGTSSTTGTVTSVGGTGTVAGLTLTGTVTTTGNLTLGGTLSTPVSTINDSTTVGQNLVKLANPSAIRFIRINADNTVTARTGAEFRGDIGAGTSSTTGTVTSVATGTGLTGGTITSSGTISMANMDANTIKGRITSNGEPQDLTASQVRTILNVADGATANAGTVTSVAAGTQISGMSMTITNGTMTPSIATSISNASNFRTAIGAGTGNGTVTSVATGSGLTGGTITTSGTLSVDSTVVRTTGAQFISGVKTLENSFTGSSGTSTEITSQVIAGDLPSAPLVATGLRVTATGNSVDFHGATGIIAKAVGGLSNDAILAYGIDGIFIAPSDTSIGKSLRIKGVSGTSASTTLQTNSATSSGITVTLPSSTGTLATTSETVLLTGAQTVDGVKTFSSVPVFSAGGQVSLSTGSLSHGINFQSGQTFGGPSIRASATNLQRTYYTDTAIIWDQLNSFYDGSSSTVITTAAKVATITGFQRNIGVIVRIRFTEGSRVASPSLNISSTGAANIRIEGANATIDNFSLSQNTEVLFRWDGSFYQVLSVNNSDHARLIATGFTFDSTITDNTFYNVYGARFILLQGIQSSNTLRFNLWLDMTDTAQVSTTARTHRVVWNDGASTFADSIGVQLSGTSVRFSSSAGGTWTYRLTGF
jgi:hypothetical protein